MTERRINMVEVVDPVTGERRFEDRPHEADARDRELPDDDEPSVMGAGDGLSPMPLRSEAEAVWRRFYVDRMVERGIDRESAQACCDAGDADLSLNPADAADDQLQYWTDDDGE